MRIQLEKVAASASMHTVTGEQQALKPMPEESSLAKKINSGRSAIQRSLNRVRDSPALKKVKWEAGTSNVRFAAKQKIEPNSPLPRVF